MGTKTASTISIKQILSDTNSSSNGTDNSHNMTAIAPTHHQKGSEDACAQRRWSKLDCSISPYSPSSSINASNSSVKVHDDDKDESLVPGPPSIPTRQTSEELPMFNSPPDRQQDKDSSAAKSSSTIRQQRHSGPRAKKSIMPSNGTNRSSTLSLETPKQDGIVILKKKTSLTFAEVVLDEAFPSPPTMPQRRETLQLSPTSARKTSASLLPDYDSDDDNSDLDNPHTCGPINGKKKKKEVKGILKKKLSDSTVSTSSSSTTTTTATTRSSDASSHFDDDTAPAPPTMPQRRETIQLSPKEPKKTSLTFATPNLDEPVPAPPAMPIRRETLQLSPKTARQTSLTLINDEEFNGSLLLSDDEDENEMKQREVKSILKNKKEKSDQKEGTSTSLPTSSRVTSIHDHNEAVPGPPLAMPQRQETLQMPFKKSTSLTFADAVLDEPVPAPPSMPVRRETLQLSPKAARKASLTLESETPDLDWDEEDEDTFNKIGSCRKSKNKEEVKSILKKKDGKKKTATVQVRKQRSVSPGRKNRRPVVRAASPTRNSQ